MKFTFTRNVSPKPTRHSNHIFKNRAQRLLKLVLHKKNYFVNNLWFFSFLFLNYKAFGLEFLKKFKELTAFMKKLTKNWQCKISFLTWFFDLKSLVKGQNWVHDFWKILVKTQNQLFRSIFLTLQFFLSKM